MRSEFCKCKTRQNLNLLILLFRYLVPVDASPSTTAGPRERTTRHGHRAMPDAHSLARRARAGAPTDRQTDRPAGRTDRHRPRAPAMHGAHRHRHADMPPHTKYPHSITHSRVTRRSPLSSRRRSHTHVTPHSHCRYLTPTHTNQSITQHTHPARASLESYLAAPPSRARAGSSLHAFSR